MKKILLSLFVLLAMLAGGCKKDKPLTLEQKILGKWTWVKYEEFQIPASPSDITDNHPASDYWEFKADGSLKVFTFNQTYSETWSKVNDNSLIINGNPISSFKITIASAKQLVLQQEGSNNGITYITRQTFSKP
jgi:hypothetical protein